MSKSFKADLSVVTDEVPSQLTVDAGALAERVNRGQRRHKVAASALSVLLVTGLGFGGYTVLSTLNHDSEPAAPLPSESQIVWDRPGVGDYSPACGAVWDPPALSASDQSPINEFEMTFGEVEITESDLKAHLETTLNATTSFDISLPADGETRLSFGLERYVYLTKDSVVVARSGHGASWPLVGLSLPRETDHEFFGDGTQFSIPLIDCTSETPLSWDGSDMTYYETGEPLPPGTYQLHGHLPNVHLSKNDLRLAEGDLWVGPVLVTIPASDQDTTKIIAPGDRPGVGDYSPVCGAVWDPPAADNDLFVQHGARLIPGAVTISTVASDGTESPRQWARTALSPEVPGDSGLSVALGIERYSFLTKDSVVVAWWVKEGASNLLPSQITDAHKSNNLLNVPLIDCRTAGVSNTDSAGQYLSSGQPLPPGDYQLHGYIPGSLVDGEAKVIAQGNIWMEPALVTIPAPDQDTAPVTAPADPAEAAAYNPTCGAIWDPAMTVDDDVFVKHGVRITLGDGGVIVPQPGWSPVLMSATAMTNLDLSAAQDLSIIFTPGSYAYLTKDSVVVALSTSDHGGLIPGTKLPYEQKHSEDLGNEGTWLGLTLADCNLVEDGTAANKIPDEAFLPAGQYQLYGKVQAELVRDGVVVGSGSIWTGPAQVLIPEQAPWPPSDS